MCLFQIQNTKAFIFFSHFYFVFVDRRNDKAIINSHTQVEVPGFEPGHDIRPNNFDILPVELGLLDSSHISYHLCKVISFQA